jgi:hypothetical protein
MAYHYDKQDAIARRSNQGQDLLFFRLTVALLQKQNLN